MLNEAKIYIEEDQHNDKLSLYLVERHQTSKIHYTIGADGILVEHSVLYNPGIFQKIQPLVVFPLHFGRAFLSLLNDEITKQGINTHKVDMQAGKTELLQESLTFANQQLVKFIDHLTTQPLQIHGSTR